MSEPRRTTSRVRLTNRPRNRAIASLARVALVAIALAPSACVIHEDGLLVEVALELEPAPILSEARLTQIELVPCPGTTSPTQHRHDAPVPLTLPLDTREPTWIVPRSGRYCDLMLQVESPAIGVRQAVLPLTCDGEHVALALDALAIEHAPSITVRGSTPVEDGITEPHALEELLRASRVGACP